MQQEDPKNDVQPPVDLNIIRRQLQVLLKHEQKIAQASRDARGEGR